MKVVVLFLFAAASSTLLSACKASEVKVSYAESRYIGGHPTSTCNYIANRLYFSPTRRRVFSFVRGCAFRMSVWEQELTGVSLVAGGDVLHVPRQVLVDGRSFPGVYWCKYTPELSTYRSASCGKDGWKFGSRWTP